MKAIVSSTCCSCRIREVRSVARLRVSVEIETAPLKHEYESAARSLRDGMAEMFTIQRLKLPPALYKCLGTINIIESPQSGVQKRTVNVTRWRDAAMVERWVASA